MPTSVVRAYGEEVGIGWTNPSNMLHDNASYAFATTLTNSTVYNHNFDDLPVNVSITGIMVRIDAYKSGGVDDMQVGVELTWNTGSSWTTQKPTSNLVGDATTYVLGGPQDDWGHTWTRSELTSPPAFGVRVASTGTTGGEWRCLLVTVTVAYDQTTAAVDEHTDQIIVTENWVSSILHDVWRERIEIVDSGAQRDVGGMTRNIQKVSQAGTAVTLLESDSDFATSAVRKLAAEAFGCVIQLGTDGPTLYIGDANITVEPAVFLTYPYSYMQPGLIAVGDLRAEGSFLNTPTLPTVEVRLANKLYVDQSDNANTTAKTIGQHSLGLPTVGRAMAVWAMVDTGDGWKKRVVFNGDIEDIAFAESETIVRGVQIGTSNKPVPDLVANDTLFTYEPGSTSKDTGEQIEGTNGKAVPIGVGRFDYGAVKRPPDFPVGHPFRFTAEPGPPAEDLRTYSHIALFPAMMGLLHPMLPTLHVARKYRRLEGMSDEETRSWPWQNVHLFGARWPPALSCSVGYRHDLPLSQRYPNADTESVVDFGSLYNADDYVCVFSWSKSSHGSYGVPYIKPRSGAWYTNQNEVGPPDWVTRQAGAGFMDQLRESPTQSWTDGTADRAFGIYTNDGGGLPENSKKVHGLADWPGPWQVIGLPMGGLTVLETQTRRQPRHVETHLSQESTGYSPTFETVNVTDPENAIDLQDPEGYARIADGGSLSMHGPIDGPNLGDIVGVRFCMIWNTSTTSSSAVVKIFARHGPFTNTSIRYRQTFLWPTETKFNESKNVVHDLTDYGRGDYPSMKVVSADDRAFASIWLSPYWWPLKNQRFLPVSTDLTYLTLNYTYQGTNFEKTGPLPGTYFAEWKFLAKDFPDHHANEQGETVDWPSDVMVRVTGDQLDVYACWFEVVHKSKVAVPETHTVTTPRRVLDIAPLPFGLPEGQSATQLVSQQREYEFPYTRDPSAIDSKVFVTGIGARDTGDGAITGTGNRIIENPADVAALLIWHYLGKTVFDARATGSTFGSFATARTLLGATTYRMSLVVNPSQPIPLRLVMQQIADQSKSIIRERLDAVGNLQWVMFVDDPDPETNDNARMYTGFTNNLIVWDNIFFRTFTAELVPFEALSSSVTLRYGLHVPSSEWSDEHYCMPESTTFTSDQALYKDAMEFAKKEYKVENPVTIDAPDIWDPAVAEDLCKWHCNIRRLRRVAVEFETFRNGLDIEVGHVIKFDDEIADRVPFPGEGSGSWSNHQFVVTHVEGAKDVGQLARVFVRALEVHATP